MRTKWCLAVGALGLWLMQACGGNHGSTPPATVKPEQDAGSGTELPDGDIPLPREDAGTPDTTPGEPEPGLQGTCAIDSNKIFTIATRSDPFTSTPLAVDPVQSSFVLPYIDSGECLDAVHMAQMAGSAASGEPESSVIVDDCALVRDAVMTAIGDHWLLALIDNRDPPYDVWVETYDAQQHKTGSGQRFSQGSSVETSMAMATLRDREHAMLAFSDQDDAAGQTLYVRPLNADGSPAGEAVVIDHSDSLFFSRLAVSQLGATGAALAYVRYSPDYATSDIVFVALDASGTPSRDPWVLAGKAGPSPSVDLAIDADGGGIVFGRAEASTGRQLWFQQIDDTGQAATLPAGTSRAPALRFVNAPFKGIDVAVTKLRSTYAVAYRALPGPGQDRAQIRLYFLDRYGAVIGDSDVSYTSASGGGTAIKTAYDGRIVLGWSEVLPDGDSVIKAVRLPCVGG